MNFGAYYDKTTKAGIACPVKLIGKRGSLDQSSNKWTYQLHDIAPIFRARGTAALTPAERQKRENKLPHTASFAWFFLVNADVDFVRATDCHVCTINGFGQLPACFFLAGFRREPGDSDLWGSLQRKSGYVAEMKWQMHSGSCTPPRRRSIMWKKGRPIILAVDFMGLEVCSVVKSPKSL
ncbi:hypothetical protein MRB53_029752 [Persea americana]|uniref:Uncharacterized protein n=1 Tax=Persea americana TaxID=3435 RepID=A0ACC2KJY5_PERAE|nr:hypothetical protein MRB53_029752 [Persea americana]